LHPNAQRTLYKQLKSFKGQKIVSTHSPYVAGQAELDELRHFYKDADASMVSKIDFCDDKEICRKVKNEVLETRGEVLFSKTIVTYEGQTEKLCLPIFAFEYFGQSPFELGIFFTDASGNNHKPFIKLANSLNIPWFVFSDFDKQNIKQGVENALTEVNHSIDSNRLVKLEKTIEDYLIECGYQNEIKKGINCYYLESCDESTPIQQIEAGQNRVNNLNDNQLITELKKDDSKVKYPIYWAKEIVKRNDAMKIPPKIRELFEKISEQMNLKPISDE
jgi:putative ATP-dependent endonuclease of OLD family